MAALVIVFAIDFPEHRAAVPLMHERRLVV